MGVATAVAIGSTLVSAGMSASQAAKQSRMQKQAEAEAAKAIADARAKLDVNFYDKLSVKKEPYELAIEAANVAAAQAIQAGQESERGTAATAGRIMMADTDNQRQIATAYGQELTDLEKLSATEDSRLRDVNTQIDLSQAEGAQKAARDAQEAKAAATTAAVNSAVSAVGQGITAANLYSQNAKQQKIAGKSFSNDQYSKLGNMDQTYGFGAPMTGGSNYDAATVQSMDKATFKKWFDSLGPDQQKILLGKQ
jgi:hypothetical protein